MILLKDPQVLIKIEGKTLRQLFSVQVLIATYTDACHCHQFALHLSDAIYIFSSAHLIQHRHTVALLCPQHVVVLLAGGEPVQVDVHVPAGAEHRVLVHPNHAEVVSVLPQDLQLCHVSLVQLALRGLYLVNKSV